MIDKSGFDYLFKIVLMGDSGVGKSSLLSRFCDDIYTNNYISTTGIDFKIKTIEVEGRRIKLQIWDTAGQERFRALTKSYYRGALGVIVVYDITCSKTFDSIDDWLEDVDKHAGPGVEKLLIGNKCEMENTRQVPTERGKRVSEEKGMIFMETSAKANFNVEEAFVHITTVILDKILNQGVPRTNSSNNVALSASTNGNASGAGRKSCCSR